MNTFRKYCSPFSFNQDQLEFDFKSKKELLANKFLQSYFSHEGFFRFAIDVKESIEDEIILMAEYENGHEWWVVGFLKNKNHVASFPKAKMKRKCSMCEKDAFAFHLEYRNDFCKKHFEEIKKRVKKDLK